MKMKNKKAFEMPINTTAAFILVFFTIAIVLSFFFVKFGETGEHGQDVLRGAENDTGRIKSLERVIGIQHGGVCEGEPNSTNCYDYYEGWSCDNEGDSDSGPTCEYQIPRCKLIGGYPARSWGFVQVTCTENMFHCHGIKRSFPVYDDDSSEDYKEFNYRWLSSCVGTSSKPSGFSRNNTDTNCSPYDLCVERTCEELGGSGATQCVRWPEGDYNDCYFRCEDLTPRGQSDCEIIDGCNWIPYD